MSTTGKRQRESPGEENPAAKARMEIRADVERADRSGQSSSKEELMNRAHESVKAISQMVAGPGSKLNKADINSIAAHGHEILAVVAALNLRLAEAELEVATSKLEAANARLEASRAAKRRLLDWMERRSLHPARMRPL
ncbi:hypothetical protein EVAR_103836_1 [Eumeta japonica]|uniref:Uncharacterized protein n=1 Tax=Eumeta variegata TaxID=151549 RepID=A0A4C2AD88_EUMVA|nr:hypothetical protein EVAR_103836_1 [Eumeta japonica]